MCWYKLTSRTPGQNVVSRLAGQYSAQTSYSLFFILLLLTSCIEPKEPKQKTNTHAFFSLADYFTGEAFRLKQLHPRVNKSVSKNKITEQKTVSISNWENEFNLFISSDINKPAWEKSYRKTQNKHWTEYRALEPGLRTQIIRVRNNPDGSIAQIIVLNKTSNYLYSSSELLNYIADSLYVIRKHQHVLLIGHTNYVIRGRILQ